MIFLLDSTVISDLIKQRPEVRRQAIAHRAAGDDLVICQPIYYEALRGLFWRNATAQMSILQRRLLPLFAWTALSDVDWEQAAHFWAFATSQGKQLSDVDFLLAALAHRLNTPLVSSDADFDVLPVKREDWRVAL